MIPRMFQRGLLTIPLLGVLWLLRLVPEITENSLSGIWPLPWRLDLLTLWFMLNLALGVALLPLRWRDIVRAVIAVVLLSALVGEHVLILPLALIGIAGLLWSWRWLLAGALLSVATVLLWLNGGINWSAPQTATAITPLIFLLIVGGCSIGLNGYPVAVVPAKPDSLRQILQPVWLLPIMRTLEWGPWNTGWAMALLLLGSASVLWASGTALWTTDRTERIERILTVWLGMALACTALLTTVGIASALWQVLAYTVGTSLLLRDERWSWWAGPVPPAVGFVAAWLAQGATAASGAFLLSGVFWLGTLLSGIAILRAHTERSIARQSSLTSTVSMSLAIVLGVLAPLPLRWLIVPAIEPLQGGLTPFGLLDIWPWVGLAALDAGHRRVAVLPSIAVVVLALVAAALVWLLARLFGWVQPPADSSAEPDTGSTSLWEQIRQQLWWIGGSHKRG